MFIELHVIQNFSPANLNRDDTNAPKDCLFGGYRRARISSQCAKRAIRQYFGEHKLLPPDQLAVRTKRIVDQIADTLAGKGRDRNEAVKVVEAALAGIGLGVKEGKSEYLLFVAREGVGTFANVCNEAWDALKAAGEAHAQPVEEGGRKKGKKKDKAELPKEIATRLSALIDGKKAVDLALFGRMLADLPGKNIDAACQVAHSIGTNEVSMEMDFYTAVDDLNPEEESGAGMMGVVEFNSSCFYRYQVLDTGKLRENLEGDGGMAKAGVLAWLEAAIKAVPTGKQNSMAAHNPPSYVRVAVRTGEPWNLANAFSKPVRPGKSGEQDIAKLSIAQLEEYAGRLERMYGGGGTVFVSSLYDNASLSVPELIERVSGTLA